MTVTGVALQAILNFFIKKTPNFHSGFLTKKNKKINLQALR